MRSHGGCAGLLSCERVFELVEHNRKVLGSVGLSFGGDLPRISFGSELHWYPALTRVCVFPIDEEVECGERDFGRWDPHRPLFYCELDASCSDVLRTRTGIRIKGQRESRRRRRKKNG